MITGNKQKNTDKNPDKGDSDTAVSHELGHRKNPHVDGKQEIGFKTDIDRSGLTGRHVRKENDLIVGVVS